GLDVMIALQAVDGAGHTVTTQALPFKLPARVFTNPLARALIEQRQVLATSTTPQDRQRVIKVLGALTLAPEMFYAQDMGTYTAIRAAYWGLRNAAHPEDVQHVSDLLWQIAVGLERGGLLNAAAELRRLQALLAQALAQGAPQDVIDELLQRYQEAMRRYMEALANNPGATPPGPPPADVKVLSQEDLNALLKAIEALAQSGDRAKAQQLLAMLQNLLENLRLSQGGSGQGGTGAMSPEDKAMSDAVRKLGELMGKQRELLDKTFKGRQGENVDPNALRGAQGDIQKQLGDIMKGLGDQKVPAPGDLKRAEGLMGDSGRELGQKDYDSSSTDQKSTLDALRSASNELAQKLLKNGGKDQQGGEEDPLGRSQGQAGPDFGKVKVPDKSDLQRARDILMELRRRAAERGRPQQELDYIDRLLKQF
ncbi:MAG: DUF4175 family protein, partial [Alphaproteobacteria bacterium]|nr:DUF4175 family protein [Alphaproteobacteria bacterium]